MQSCGVLRGGARVFTEDYNVLDNNHYAISLDCPHPGVLPLYFLLTGYGLSRVQWLLSCGATGG